MKYWLLKTEPGAWSFKDQLKEKKNNMGRCKKLPSKKLYDKDEDK